MKLLIKGCFPLFLGLAFLSRGVASYCPPKAAEHDCCGKTAPAAPKTPCAEMICCQLVPATAAPFLGQINDPVAFLPAVLILPTPVAYSFIVASGSDSGPPGPVVQSFSSRAPPLLLS